MDITNGHPAPTPVDVGLGDGERSENARPSRSNSRLGTFAG